MNDAEFIDGLRKQDPAAARHLNECFVPSIWRYVFFRVDRDPHLAEDIVAEAVLALVAAAAKETLVEHPVAWLRTVATRRIQDHYRAVARVQHLLESTQYQATSNEQLDPAATHDKKLQRQTVREAMDGLPESYRLVLEWKYIEQRSVREIAQRMGATEKSAESTLFRARKELRNRLAGEFPDPPQAESQHKQVEDQPTVGEVTPERGGDTPKQDKRSDGNLGDSPTENRPSVFVTPRLAREP